MSGKAMKIFDKIRNPKVGAKIIAMGLLITFTYVLVVFAWIIPGVVESLLDKRSSPALQEMMKFECDRARAYYQKAHDILQTLPASDQKALVVAEIMRGVYSTILHKIETQNYPVFGPRTRISSFQRLSIAANIWLRSFFTRHFAPSM